jgi:hypothetical protein
MQINMYDENNQLKHIWGIRSESDKPNISILETLMKATGWKYEVIDEVKKENQE